MQQELKVALFAGVVPGVLVGLALLAAVILWRRSTKRAQRGDASATEPVHQALARWPVPLAMLLAYPIANSAVFTGLPKLWPLSATERMPHAVVLLALVALLESLVRLPREIAFLLRAGAIAGASWVLGGAYVPRVVSVETFVGFTGLAAVLGAGAIALAERGAAVLGPRAASAVLVVWAGAMVPLLFLAGSANGAQTAGPLLVAFGVALAVMAWVRPGVALSGGALTALVGVAVCAALAPGWQNDTPPIPALVLMALAPAGLVGAGSADGALSGRSPAWWPGWRRVAGAAALGAVALAIAGAQVGMRAAASAESGY